jgi:nitrogen fixation NifU-like protein
MTANPLSATHLRMARDTERCRSMARPDGFGENTGECGDTVRIFLQAPREEIQQVTFETDGCLHTRACANTVAELAGGLPVEAAWHIGPETIIAFLETLPEAHHHCAELAAGALYRALTDLRENRRKPWQRLYGTRR